MILNRLLFIRVTEYLSKMTSMFVEDGTLDEFKVSRRENGLVISHLQFAGYTIFFLDTTLDYALALKKVLISFEMISGLGINL